MDPIDVEELQDVLDATEKPETLTGRLITWYDDKPYPLVLLQNGTPAIRVKLACARCNKRHLTAYVVHGAPGCCYAFDRTGARFLADLRNQEFVCYHCQEGHTP